MTATVRPDYYNEHPSGIECIDVVQHMPFNTGTAVKYLWRAGLKPTEDSVTDLRKALTYIEFEIARLSGQPTPARTASAP